MDDYDYSEVNQPAGSSSGLIFNVLTVLALLATVVVAIIFLMIFFNPYAGVNPFPPPTLPVAISMPTLTPTPREVLPPTWTPEPTLSPTVTSTPRPTATPTPTVTPFSLFTSTPTEGSSPGEGGNEEFSFALAQGSPSPISSVNFLPNEGCNWMGVAGQVLDLSGSPVNAQVIELGGLIEGRFVQETSITGVAPFLQNGYEFELTREPVASNNTLWVQLLDQYGLPMSDKIFFQTYDDCDRNLVIINFRQVR